MNQCSAISLLGLSFLGAPLVAQTASVTATVPTLRTNGHSGRRYTLERSRDLTQWTTDSTTEILTDDQPVEFQPTRENATDFFRVRVELP